MCIIIDANIAHKVFCESPSDDYKPIFTGLEKGKICIVFGGQLASELKKTKNARRFLQKLAQAGRAALYPDEHVHREQTAIDKGLCKSNDLHIIALARLSGARTLCTDDANLQKDFRNAELVANPRGHIYKNKKHEPLLKRSCPNRRI